MTNFHSLFYNYAIEKKKMKTIQYRKSRIWDKYTKGLTNNQVCAMFYMQDIRKNVLPKFI